MVNIASWNIRGYNSPYKQKEVYSFWKKKNIDILAVLETKLNEQNVMLVKKKWWKEYGFD